jgi:HEAT repeat protein
VADGRSASPLDIMTEEQWRDLTAALRDTGSLDSALTAASTLKALASAEDVPRLLSLLEDPDFFVREAAAWPLSDLGCTDALPALIRAKGLGYAEGHDNDGLNAAMSDLVSMNSPAARPILERLSKSSDPYASETAQWLLDFCKS